jgi:hypothetical protein
VCVCVCVLREFLKETKFFIFVCVRARARVCVPKKARSMVAKFYGKVLQLCLIGLGRHVF